MNIAALIAIQNAVSDRFGYGRPLRIYWQFRSGTDRLVAVTMRVAHLRHGYDLETTSQFSEEFLSDADLGSPAAHAFLAETFIESINLIMQEEQT